MRVHLSPQSYFVLANSDNSGEQTRLSLRCLHFHFHDLVPSCTKIRKQIRVHIIAEPKSLLFMCLSADDDKLIKFHYFSIHKS